MTDTVFIWWFKSKPWLWNIFLIHIDKLMVVFPLSESQRAETKAFVILYLSASNTTDVLAFWLLLWCAHFNQKKIITSLTLPPSALPPVSWSNRRAGLTTVLYTFPFPVCFQKHSSSSTPLSSHSLLYLFSVLAIVLHSWAQVFKLLDLHHLSFLPLKLLQHWTPPMSLL